MLVARLDESQDDRKSASFVSMGGLTDRAQCCYGVHIAEMSLIIF